MSMKLTDTENNAWVGLVRSQQLLLDKVEKKFKEKGLPPLSWYDVLLELEKVEDGKLRLNDLGERVLLSKFNVTRLLHRLEKKGLICRESCMDDSRGVFAVITEKGREIRRKMWPVYYKVIKNYFLSKFDNEELDAFAKCVNKLKNIEH